VNLQKKKPKINNNNKYFLIIMRDFRPYSFLLVTFVFITAAFLLRGVNWIFSLVFLICFVFTAIMAIQLYVYFLFWPYPSWIDTTQVTIQKVEVPSKIEGQNLNAVVIRSKLSDPGDKQPGILFHHGKGGNIKRTYKYTIPLAVYGCTILCIDARGHGMSKNKQFNKHDIEGIFSDIENEISFLENLGGVNKHKLCMMGTSMGGWASLTAGYQDQRIKKIVGISGPYDILGRTKKHKTLLSKHLFKKITQNVKDDLESWNRKVSPKYFFEKKSPIPDKDRVYLVHGKEDNLVIFKEALLAKKALNLPDENVLFLDKPERKYMLSAHVLTGQETIVTAFLIKVVDSIE
jgi:dipeptidyl aminopeptidase/acylaminoacyl peptidase